MERPDVEDVGGKNAQSDRTPEADQDKQPANKLHRANGIEVAASRQGMEKLSGQARRGRFHWDEMEKEIGAKYNEGETEQHASDYGQDFHGDRLPFRTRISNIEFIRPGCSFDLNGIGS